MTETREQWIERESRMARERYWGGIGDWDSDGESIRQDWRNVVAPFYPEPLRVPVDVEGLAKAMCDAASRESEHYLCAEWNTTSYRDSFRAAARTALAYLNIEPCAKPEYNPVDVAFRDALKKSQEIVNNWTPEQRNHNSIGYVGLQDNERAELENLRVEVKNQSKTIKAMCEENAKLRVEASEATAKAERQRQALDANRKTIESRGAEIARLENEVKRLRTQQPETRPVKVRFPYLWNLEIGNLIFSELQKYGLDTSVIAPPKEARQVVGGKVRGYLAAHAVIDVPAGVPTYRELREIGVNAYLSHDSAKRENAGCMVDPMGSAAAAIRDAVLAGIQRRVWTNQELEELAREITKGRAAAQGDLDIATAYTALAWFDGKRGDV